MELKSFATLPLLIFHIISFLWAGKRFVIAVDNGSPILALFFYLCMLINIYMARLPLIDLGFID